MTQVQTAARPSPSLRRRNDRAKETAADTGNLVKLAGLVCLVALALLVAGWLFAPDDVARSLPGRDMTLGDLNAAKPMKIAGVYNPDDPESLVALRKPAPPAADAAQPEAPAETAAAADAAPEAGEPAVLPVATTPPPAAAAARGPVLVLVLTEAGESPAATREAIARLPETITLGFSPYAESSRRLAEVAREDGHEVLIGLPMQPKAYPAISPGANTLLVGQSAQELRDRLGWALGRIAGADGVYTMMGSAFTTSRSDYAALLKALGARGLPIIDSRSIGSTLGPALAKDSGVTLHLNNQFIEGNAADARKALDELAARARKEGHAVGFMRASPELVGALEGWLPRASNAGVRLAPMSALAGVS